MGDDIDRVLGAFSPLDPPHWLGELPLTSKRIIAHELVWPAGGPDDFDDESASAAMRHRSLPARPRAHRALTSAASSACSTADAAATEDL